MRVFFLSLGKGTALIFVPAAGFLDNFFTFLKEGNVAGILGDSFSVQLASNYIISDFIGLMKGGVDGKEITAKLIKISPDSFAELMSMVKKGAISSRGAKDTLKIMYESGGLPETIAKERGLLQQSDESTIKTIVEKVIAENPKVAEEFKAGKAASLQFLVGQGMKLSKGSANPEVLKKLLTQALVG